MSIVTNALVIKVNDSGESDRIVTLLSAELGVVRAFANRAKKINGRMNAATQTFCYGEFTLYAGKDSYTVDSVTSKEVFFGLREDIVKLALGQYFCTLALDLVPEGEPAPDSLRVILNSLSFLEKGRRSCDFLKSVTELKLLSLAGFTPNLTACSVCGENPAGNVGFDIAGGTFSCGKHGRGDIVITPGVLTAMRHIISSPVDRSYSFTLTPQDEKLLGSVCERFAVRHTGRNLKALEFYNNVKEGEAQ